MEPTIFEKGRSLSQIPITVTQKEMCTYFSQYRKIPLPFCSTLALIAIPRPSAHACKMAGTIEQIGGYNFSTEGKKKKKISACHNSLNSLN